MLGTSCLEFDWVEPVFTDLGTRRYLVWFKSDPFSLKGRPVFEELGFIATSLAVVGDACRWICLCTAGSSLLIGLSVSARALARSGDDLFLSDSDSTSSRYFTLAPFDFSGGESGSWFSLFAENKRNK